jgi:hypothetical protein
MDSSQFFGRHRKVAHDGMFDAITARRMDLIALKLEISIQTATA